MNEKNKSVLYCAVCMSEMQVDIPVPGHTTFLCSDDCKDKWYSDNWADGQFSRYTFADYQRESRKTAIYPNIGSNITYPTLGLCGESGEVAEKVKKILRDNHGQVGEDRKELLSKELGDVLWYLSNLASELGLDLQSIAVQNIRKLRKRQQENKLHGSGDAR